jgi:hypothetical protein
MNDDPNKVSNADSELTSKPSVLDTEDAKQFAQATDAAVAAGQQIAKDFQSLGHRQRLRVARVFRRQLFPPRSPGRKRSNRITAAHTDWKAGLRGVALYRKHILGWGRHGYWRRKAESRALLDAIRARSRREQAKPRIP